MKLTLPLLVLFGPLAVVVLGYMTMLLVWHHRLSGGNLAPEARERIRNRAQVFALVVKYSGWGWLAYFILLAVLWKVLRHD